MEFSETQIQRYARHIILKEVGGIGQKKLLNSKVLIVGAGGLGSPVALYLAAAGVGTLGIIDHDTVEFSNLQRQILHATCDIGKPKVKSAEEKIAHINPDIKVIKHHKRITAKNAISLFYEYDIIADGSDNFETRFLVNDASFLTQRTLVSAAISRFDGQVATFKAYKTDKSPCHRCLYGSPSDKEQILNCSETGVFGSICGVIGSLQASEILKEILEIGESLSGSLVIFDGLNLNFRKVKLKKDPECPLCGKRSSIKDLSSHEE